MKLPKLLDGPFPEGERDVAGLERIDAPWISKILPDGAVHKKGGAYQITHPPVATGAPYIWGLMAIVGDSTLPLWWTDPENKKYKAPTYTTIYTTPGGAYLHYSPWRPYVGDGLMLQVACNAYYENYSTVFWPVLIKAAAPGAEAISASVPASTVPGSVSYIDQVQYVRLSEVYLNMSLWCSGWDSDANHYAYGVSSMVYNDPEHKYPTGFPWSLGQAGPDGIPSIFVAVAYRSSTLMIAFTNNVQPVIPTTLPIPPNAVPVPSSHGGGAFITNPRDQTRFRVGVIGLGKLRYFQAIPEMTDAGSSDGYMPQILPYRVDSTDHGRTWTKTDAAWLAPYISLRAAIGGVRAHYDNEHLEFLFARISITYIGNGRHMVVLPAGFVSNTGSSVWDIYFAPMAFIDSGGGTYTRMSWPADSWLFNMSADQVVFPSTHTSPPMNFPMVGSCFMGPMNGSQLSYGVDCFYMPFWDDARGKWFVLFTVDAGASWTQSIDFPDVVPMTIEPTFVQSGQYFAARAGFTGVVIQPLVKADDGVTILKKGLLAFIAPDYVNNKMRYYECNGLFEAFTEVAGGQVSGTLDGSFVDQAIGRCWTYTGNTDNKNRLPHIHPAFPEFDKP